MKNSSLLLEEEVEYNENGEAEVYVDRVTDPELILTLTPRLKAQI